MITYPLIHLGQTQRPLSPEAQKFADTVTKGLEPVAAQIQAEYEAKMKDTALKAAIIGGSIGLIVGMVLTPMVQDMMGTVRVKRVDLERTGLRIS